MKPTRKKAKLKTCSLFSQTPLPLLGSLFSLPGLSWTLFPLLELFHIKAVGLWSGEERVPLIFCFCLCWFRHMIWIPVSHTNGSVLCAASEVAHSRVLSFTDLSPCYCWRDRVCCRGLCHVTFPDTVCGRWWRHRQESWSLLSRTQAGNFHL